MFLIISALIFLFLFRVLYIIPHFNDHFQATSSKKKKILVVLGSAPFEYIGGHTTEIIMIIKELKLQGNISYVFVYGNDDLFSKNHALKLDVSNHKKFIEIPRARKVGQSFLTSVFTTLVAFYHSFFIIVSEKPDIILCNGPAICVPIVIASYIPRILGIKWIFVLYIESFARVKSLSLSGKILYPLADNFIVQWEYLGLKYARAKLKKYII
ncbi:hypothetical protein BB559_001720 [Furculomyces boomerangus]|uniref:UDP-N-acetylglucosamine transferase subunit ALG14 n=2 Tax=Harpellales TaxID=61421 RepID=A0A2T9Z0W2_9FUNG|nr:hypothetical protein BB559_001720 [Furculomyces boomerangus]PVZ96532.1 hypothetical protein BB558_007568 [Smittium angustum]